MPSPGTLPCKKQFWNHGRAPSFAPLRPPRYTAAPSRNRGTTPPVLDVDRLSYAYPDTDLPALRDLSFSIAPGELMLLLGANGAGKSTLCYALAGFVPHFFNGEIEGEITLDGHSMRSAQLRDWVRRVGLVLQNPFNQITGARATVFEEVAFGLENLGVPREEIGRRVQQVLERLKIAPLAERSPFALSGGQMQRVAIASIVVLEPRLLVLDEPTAQLDPAGTEEVIEVLSGLAEGGVIVVVATQKVGELLPLATRALVLQEGRIVADGAAADVVRAPDLPAWGVEPPVIASLARAVALPPPVPLTVAEALPTLTPPLPPLRAGEAVWPLAPPLTSGPLPSFPAVPPTPVVISDVEFAYPSGVAALQGVSLTLPPARISALIGANGAGKSTLSRTINGLLRPRSGTIAVGDWQVADRKTSELAARVGYLFQNPADQLFKSTVADEVAFGPRSLGFEAARVTALVERALQATGLGGAAEAHPYDLHPVQRRWVALASVLALGAPVLVLDEPTSGLDFFDKQRMAALLDRLREAGHTLLVISHDMQFVAEVADRLLVMDEGRLLAGGAPSALFARHDLLAAADVEAPPIARLSEALAFPALHVRARALLAALLAAPPKEGEEA